MLVDHEHAAVRSLLAEWHAFTCYSGDERDRASDAFQQALARNILGPALAQFPNELILTYHKFLSMRPSDEHSFAHGSTMVSERIYWVMVGRLKNSTDIIETKESAAAVGLPGRFRIRVATPPMFLVPVRWRIQLWVNYQGRFNTPGFVIERPSTVKLSTQVMDSDPLDLSLLGQHLFRTTQGELDWATESSVAVGDDAVGAWLEKQHSSDTYAQLKAW